MTSEAERPQISLYLFPYLAEFLVADTRPQVLGRPTLLIVPWREVLDNLFLSEVEKGVATLLREGGAFPLAHLLTLPTRVEGIVREAGIRAILRRLGIPLEGEDIPRIGVFLVAGQAIRGGDEALDQAIGELVEHLSPPSFREETARALKQMLQQEQETLRRLERDALQRALFGETPGFYTLWQKPEKDA